MVDKRETGTFLPYGAQPVLADPANPLTSPAATTDLHGINNGRTWFVRADGLAHVTDDSTAELSYQHQDDFSNGFAFEYPGADYVINRRIPRNPSETRTDIGAMTLTEDFGFATVTSSTSYYNVDTHDMYDNSGLDVVYPYYYGGYPRTTTTNYDVNTDQAFTQEVRLVSATGNAIDYVVGGYFQNRRDNADSLETVPGFAAWANTPGSETNPAYTSFADQIVNYYGGTRPGTLNPADLTYDFRRAVHYSDLAGFGEVTWHITPDLRATGGVRVFDEDFRQTTVQHIYNAGTTFGTDSLGTSEGTGAKRTLDKIFKANLAYDLGPATLTYFTFSQGFRSGGANAYPVGACLFCNDAALLTFGPDSVDNFELGLKGQLGALRYTAAIYDMEWSRVQVEVASAAGTPIIINGNNARSQGLELEGHYPFTAALTLSGGYSYTNAVLTEGFLVDGQFSAAKGTLLPGVPHHQVNLSADYLLALGQHDVTLHTDGSWRSGQNNQLETNLANFRHLSGYALVNASVTTALAPHLTLELFAHNLFNAKGVSAASSLAPSDGSALSGNYLIAHAFEAAEFVSPPLTVGLRIVIRH